MVARPDLPRAGAGDRARPDDSATSAAQRQLAVHYYRRRRHGLAHAPDAHARGHVHWHHHGDHRRARGRVDHQRLHADWRHFVFLVRRDDDRPEKD